MSLHPKTWPRWLWPIIAILLALHFILGSRELGAWPFGLSSAPMTGPSVTFATSDELSGVSGRVLKLEQTAAAKADVSEMKAEIEKLKAAVSALAGDKRKGVRTGSVK